MSDNKTVPSAEAILKYHQKLVAIKYHLGTTLVIGHRPTYYNEASTYAMHEHTRLHLEAMAKEIAEKARTRTNDESTSIIVDEKTIQKAATDYISKIK